MAKDQESCCNCRCFFGFLFGEWTCGTTCCCCCDWTPERNAKIGHLLLFFALFIASEVFGYELYTAIDDLPGVDLTSGCDEDYIENCVEHQLVYRASAAMFIMFLLLAPLSFCFRILHTGWWGIKIFFSFGLFISFWWMGNGYFTYYANITRVLALVWHIIQNILILDTIHDVQDFFEEKMSSESVTKWCWAPAYAVLAVCSLALSIICCVLLYEYYGECWLNDLLISITCIAGVMITAASLLPRIHVGLLTPSMVFVYSTYLCFNALVSVDSETCNPDADDYTSWTYILSQFFSVSALLISLWWTSWKSNELLDSIGGAGLKKKKSQDEKRAPLVEEESKEGGDGGAQWWEEETGGRTVDEEEAGAASAPAKQKKQPKERRDRWTYHSMLASGSLFMAMTLTDWGTTDGSPISENTTWEAPTSFWMKVSAQWIVILMQLRVLQVNYQR
mmetsp:Transcript_46528/g.80183  ORF Transcript_46528/g.80183 Transcript_46528/m.80183 type:complete len:449 (+) Transcript_46528:132-1478(+)